MEFKTIEIEDFIKTEIPSYQIDLLLQSFNSTSEEIEFYDTIGKEMTGENNSDKMLLKAGPSIQRESFWEKVKGEVYKIICTEDKKYSSERTKLGLNFKEAVTIIATAIATTFSVGTGVITGLVTNVLISIMKINQNAWCEYYVQNHKTS